MADSRHNLTTFFALHVVWETGICKMEGEGEKVRSSFSQQQSLHCAHLSCGCRSVVAAAEADQ